MKKITFKITNYFKPKSLISHCTAVSISGNDELYLFEDDKCNFFISGYIKGIHQVNPKIKIRRIYKQIVEVPNAKSARELAKEHGIKELSDSEFQQNKTIASLRFGRKS